MDHLVYMFIISFKEISANFNLRLVKVVYFSLTPQNENNLHVCIIMLILSAIIIIFYIYRLFIVLVNSLLIPISHQ